MDNQEQSELGTAIIELGNALGSPAGLTADVLEGWAASPPELTYLTPEKWAQALRTHSGAILVVAAQNTAWGAVASAAMEMVMGDGHE